MKFPTLIGLFTAATLLGGCNLMGFRDPDAAAQHHLDVFDDLDYNVITNQKWDELPRSHSQLVVVHWPDGHSTKGLDAHAADLKAMSAWAPDLHVLKHPTKIGEKSWTAVTGVMEGTFTKPMPARFAGRKGKSIKPTRKSFRIEMVTVAHWDSHDVIDEEFLYWDNQELMRQIGVK